MITFFVVAGTAYVVGSYVVIGRMLFKNPGPAGLGLLCLPLAPLVLPYGMWQTVRGLWKRVGGS